VWLVLLLVLVALTIKSFRRVDPVGAWLLVPYLLWLSFAGYLNLGIRYLN
jgi:tryptophan-rich sensory protein